MLRRRLATLRSRSGASSTPDVDPGREELAALARRLDEISDRLSGLERGLDEARRERWSARAVGLGDRVLVGCRHLALSFLMDSDDLLLLPQFLAEGDYERGTTEFLKRTVPVDGVAIDVGANFGYYTCLLARLAWQGRVLALEPDPDVFALLRDNIAANWCTGVVTPMNAAASDRGGNLTLHRRPSRTGNTSIAAPTQEELERSDRPTEPFEVGCVSLDELTEGWERVDVVKIDVEGAEPLVLAGMTRLVERHAPTVVMEWSPDQTAYAGSSAVELVGLIERLGLRANRVLPDGSLEHVPLSELATLDYQNIVLSP